MADKLAFPIPHRRVRLTADGIRFGALRKYGAGFKTYELLQIAKLADGAGFLSADVWGYGLVEPCMTQLHDDPWQRLKSLKRAFRRTPLCVTLHSRTLTGVPGCSAELIERFVRMAAENGADEFAIFDEENRLADAPVFAAVKKTGKRAVAVMSYHSGEFVTAGELADAAKALVEAGYDELALVDPAGVITPPMAYNMVRTLKQAVSVPVQFGCTNENGLAALSSWEAIRAGADAIRTVFSCLFFEGSYPSSESIAASLAGTPADTGMDLPGLIDLNDLVRSTAARLESEKPAPVRRKAVPAKSWEDALRESGAFARSDEDVMLYALYPDCAEEFLRGKYGLTL